MNVDIEETLGRELHEVADGLRVPAMPPLPEEAAPARRHWQPLLVAAAVVLIIVGALAVAANVRGGQEPAPAPPSPSPSRTQSAATLLTTASTVPYVLDNRLYVDGQRVPGDWWSVSSGPDGWVGLRTDNTWWWGRGPEPRAIEAKVVNSPVLSPSGLYIGETVTSGGRGMVAGFDTDPSGEGLGGFFQDLEAPDGTPVTVRAVTDDARVIVQGTGTSLLWLPLVDGSTVDLSETAPGQVVQGNTPAGLIVTDGEEGAPYLAEVSDAGELTPIGTAPDLDAIVGSPDGGWLAGTPRGAMGGEVTTVATLEAESVDGSRHVELTAPPGWDFRVLSYVWEDEDHLVSPVLADDAAGGERMVRCSVDTPRCVLIDSP